MTTNRLITPRSLTDWSRPSPELVNALSQPFADMGASEPDQLGGHAAAHCLPWCGMPMPISEYLRALPATGVERGVRPAVLLLPGAAGRASTGCNPATSAAACSRGTFTPWADSGVQLETGHFRGLMNASPLLTARHPPTKPNGRLYVAPANGGGWSQSACSGARRGLRRPGSVHDSFR